MKTWPGVTREEDISMTELQKITQDNFLDAFALRLAPGQEE